MLALFGNHSMPKACRPTHATQARPLTSAAAMANTPMLAPTSSTVSPGFSFTWEVAGRSVLYISHQPFNARDPTPSGGGIEKEHLLCNYIPLGGVALCHFGATTSNWVFYINTALTPCLRYTLSTKCSW